MFLNNDEKIIFNSYINTYMNSLKMDPKVAKKAAKTNIVKAKKTAIREGIYNLPSDYWKEIFDMEKNKIDNKFTRYNRRAREDGVKDEDFIYLWETHPVERVMLQETQNMININAHLTALGEGKTSQEATEIVRKNFPTYGDPNIRSNYGTEDDNLLPIEFVFKVNKNVISNPNSDKLKEELKNFSSFNAYIRYLAKEDRLGKL